MKSFFVIISLACIGSVFTSNVSNSVPPNQVTLRGTLAGNGTMRNLPPVEAYQNAFDVLLVFNEDLGDLMVEVVDENGETVFKTTENTVAVGNLTIDINGWKKGEYTLLIMDEQGDSLEGIFLID